MPHATRARSLHPQGDSNISCTQRRNGHADACRHTLTRESAGALPRRAGPHEVQASTHRLLYTLHHSPSRCLPFHLPFPLPCHFALASPPASATCFCHLLPPPAAHCSGASGFRSTHRPSRSNGPRYTTTSGNVPRGPRCAPAAQPSPIGRSLRHCRTGGRTMVESMPCSAAKDSRADTLRKGPLGPPSPPPLLPLLPLLPPPPRFEKLRKGLTPAAATAGCRCPRRRRGSSAGGGAPRSCGLSRRQRGSCATARSCTSEACCGRAGASTKLS